MRLIDFLRDYREAVEEEKERQERMKNHSKIPASRYTGKRHR